MTAPYMTAPERLAYAANPIEFKSSMVVYLLGGLISICEIRRKADF